MTQKKPFIYYQKSSVACRIAAFVYWAKRHSMEAEFIAWTAGVSKTIPEGHKVILIGKCFDAEKMENLRKRQPRTWELDPHAMPESKREHVWQVLRNLGIVRSHGSPALIRVLNEIETGGRKSEVTKAIAPVIDSLPDDFQMWPNLMGMSEAAIIKLAEDWKAEQEAKKNMPGAATRFKSKKEVAAIKAAEAKKAKEEAEPEPAPAIETDDSDWDDPTPPIGGKKKR